VSTHGAAAIPPGEEPREPRSASTPTLATVTPLPRRATVPRSLASNLAWNAASELVARGSSLWLSFACARMLPIPEFGRLSFALALSQYVWLAGDTVANSGYATREVARVRGADPHSARRLKGRILALRLGAAAALTAITAAVLAFVPMPAELRGAVAGGAVFYLSYAAFPDWALRAREDFRGLALANLAAAVALVGGTLAWLPRHPDAGTAAALWGGSFLAAALVTLSRLLPQRAFLWDGGTSGMGVHARRSLVFSIGAIGGIGCAQAPMLIVGLLASPVAAGLFGAGYRFLLVVINAFSVMWWPLVPVLLRARRGGREFDAALVAIGGVVLLLALPATLAFVIWPTELLSIAFGARYAGGADALRVAGFAVPLYATSALLEQACLATGGEGLRARVNLFALAALVATGLVLVPRLGPTGASWGLVAAFGCSVTTYVVACRRLLPWRELARRAGAPLALNAALAGGWLAARALALPALTALIAGALLYVIAAVAAGLVPGRMWRRA
jgi:O-antigen/teichoic acid export membrane protein